MSRAKQLKRTFDQASNLLGGHGRRDMQVLKEAFDNIESDRVSDIYGTGTIIEDFQQKIATLLGKETAVFFPSGTMAQQIALRIWADEKGLTKVAYHPLCHLEIHEEDGLKELHKLESVLLGDHYRVIELEDIQKMGDGIACVLLELPQREIGGQLPSFETLEQISTYCKDKGIKLHLDGARLLEVLPFYQKTADEVCALFDSVYISFYKGLGGIAGAILAGDADFIEKSKVWKKRYGGNLISLYPYIIPADYYFEKRSGKMDQYYKQSIDLAKLFNSCHDTNTVPEVPVSNMFHVHFKQPKEKMELILSEIQQTTGLGITGYVKEMNAKTCYFEISLGDSYESIPREILEESIRLLNIRMKKS